MFLRKGDWKIIVGHHELPFIFPRVYEEPSKYGGWLLDQGSLRGRFVEMLLTLTDMVVGKGQDLDLGIFKVFFISFRRGKLSLYEIRGLVQT